MLQKFSLSNLMRNCYFPLSALAFFVMQARPSKTSFAETLIASGVWLLLSACVSPSVLWKFSRRSGRLMRIFSLLTAWGVCVYSSSYMYDRFSRHPEYLTMLNVSLHTVHFACLVMIFPPMIFVYLCVNYFWYKFTGLVRSSGLTRGVSRREFAGYAMIFLVSLLMMVIIFAKSDAFYGALPFDVIYTADSGALMKPSCFLSLNHPENDIRQPLFGLFALPFMGLPYLMGRIASLFFGGEKFFVATFMNAVQIAMLIAGLFALSKAMSLSSRQRLCFMLFSSSTYTYMLNSVTMEQYIIVFFWLALSLYFMCQVPKPDSMILHGAGGTLITSLVLAPSYLLRGGGGGIFLAYIQGCCRVHISSCDILQDRKNLSLLQQYKLTLEVSRVLGAITYPSPTD